MSGIVKKNLFLIIEETDKRNGHVLKAAKYMISYTPLWATMKQKNISTYKLIKEFGFSKGTLDSLKQNRNVSTATLNDLCNILQCRVEEVLCITPDGDGDAK